MGRIRAAISAVGGTMADQWKEFFICESLDADVLAVKAVSYTHLTLPTTPYV